MGLWGSGGRFGGEDDAVFAEVGEEGWGKGNDA